MNPSTTIDFAAFRSPVLEKHVDFILEEEFSCNPSFISFFIDLAKAYRCSDKVGEYANDIPSPTESTLPHAARSVTAGAGETDVLVLYKANDETRVALLIENKVRAGFQNAQPERYRIRGDEGKADGKWDQFWTCLVAPAEYGSGNEGFDARVSVEALLTFFKAQDPRSQFRARVLNGALDHFHNQGVQNPDEMVREFRKLYAEAAQARFGPTSIEWQPAREAYSGDTWFRFTSQDMRGAYITHKAPEGQVHLSFPNTSPEQLKQVFDQTVGVTGMAVVKTNKSASIETGVDAITDFSSFLAQEATVAAAFDAVERLLELWKIQLEPLSYFDSSGLRIKEQACLILETTAEGQRVMAHVRLRGKELTVEAADHVKSADFGEETLQVSITVGTRTFNAQSDPVGWFEHLPFLYSGSYVRAVLLRDPPRYLS